MVLAGDAGADSQTELQTGICPPEKRVGRLFHRPPPAVALLQPERNPGRFQRLSAPREKGLQHLLPGLVQLPQMAEKITFNG